MCNFLEPSCVLMLPRFSNVCEYYLILDASWDNDVSIKMNLSIYFCSNCENIQSNDSNNRLLQAQSENRAFTSHYR